MNRGRASCLHDLTPCGHISGPPCADYAVIGNNPHPQNRNSPLPGSSGNTELRLPPTTCSMLGTIKWKGSVMLREERAAVTVFTNVKCFCSVLCSL